MNVQEKFNLQTVVDDLDWVISMLPSSYERLERMLHRDRSIILNLMNPGDPPIKELLG